MEKQTHYYLIGNEIKNGNKKPLRLYANFDSEQHYQAAITIWKQSLQPCQISPTDLEQIKSYYQMTLLRNEPIDCSEVVEEILVDKTVGWSSIKVTALVFKEPKSEANEVVLWKEVDRIFAKHKSESLNVLLKTFTITRNNK